MNPAETIKVKMQRALEAAASADAKLRDQGVLTNAVKQEALSVAEELKRKKALEKIEKDGFQPKNFSSSASNVKVKNSKPTATPDTSHDSAMFGTLLDGAETNTSAQTLAVRGPRYKTKTFVSQAISASAEEKEEKWIQKLQSMRKQRLRANPDRYKDIIQAGQG